MGKTEKHRERQNHKDREEEEYNFFLNLHKAIEMCLSAYPSSIQIGLHTHLHFFREVRRSPVVHCGGALLKNTLAEMVGNI